MTRKALGRGLRALIPEPETSPAASGNAPAGTLTHDSAMTLQRSGDRAVPATETVLLEDVRSIPLDAIVPSRSQPRTEWDPAGLEQLTRSIVQKGLLEPILVRPRGEKFEIIAGERRWRACQAAGWKEIPALIRPMEDRESLEAALIENLQREDLNPVEEARAYEMLTSAHGLTHEEIAHRVSKDRSTVTNLLRLLKLPDSVLRHLSQGTLTAGHARVLLSLPEDQRSAAADKMVSEGWSVRDAEAYASRLTGAMQRGARGRHARRGMQKPEHMKRIEEELCRHFGTQTRLRVGRQGGRIELRFHNEEELSRLLELMGIVVV